MCFGTDAATRVSASPPSDTSITLPSPSAPPAYGGVRVAGLFTRSQLDGAGGVTLQGDVCNLEAARISC